MSLHPGKAAISLAGGHAAGGGSAVPHKLAQPHLPRLVSHAVGRVHARHAQLLHVHYIAPLIVEEDHILVVDAGLFVDALEVRRLLASVDLLVLSQLVHAHCATALRDVDQPQALPRPLRLRRAADVRDGGVLPLGVVGQLRQDAPRAAHQPHLLPGSIRQDACLGGLVEGRTSRLVHLGPPQRRIEVERHQLWQCRHHAGCGGAGGRHPRVAVCESCSENVSRPCRRPFSNRAAPVPRGEAILVDIIRLR
mmetsp:Transcript_7614/g.19696  ORF Transcript_7614/g.19696 Transcript_7614/m.19696 type:complete len:251 (+) Transcript_7614:435-1187(+)